MNKVTEKINFLKKEIEKKAATISGLSQMEYVEFGEKIDAEIIFMKGQISGLDYANMYLR